MTSCPSLPRTKEGFSRTFGVQSPTVSGKPGWLVALHTLLSVSRVQRRTPMFKQQRSCGALPTRNGQKEAAPSSVWLVQSLSLRSTAKQVLGGTHVPGEKEGAAKRLTDWPQMTQLLSVDSETHSGIFVRSHCLSPVPLFFSLKNFRRPSRDLLVFLCRSGF